MVNNSLSNRGVVTSGFIWLQVFAEEDNLPCVPCGYFVQRTSLALAPAANALVESKIAATPSHNLVPLNCKSQPPAIMGRELQKKKNRSSNPKVRRKPKSKRVNVLGNPIVAANWYLSRAPWANG